MLLVGNGVGERARQIFEGRKPCAAFEARAAGGGSALQNNAKPLLAATFQEGLLDSDATS
ncbi:hypothetical protein WJ970_36920 [Achromobacter xylosoxidans]